MQVAFEALTRFRYETEQHAWILKQTACSASVIGPCRPQIWYRFGGWFGFGIFFHFIVILEIVPNYELDIDIVRLINSVNTLICEIKRIWQLSASIWLFSSYIVNQVKTNIKFKNESLKYWSSYNVYTE